MVTQVLIRRLLKNCAGIPVNLQILRTPSINRDRRTSNHFHSPQDPSKKLVLLYFVFVFLFVFVFASLPRLLLSSLLISFSPNLFSYHSHILSFMMTGSSDEGDAFDTAFDDEADEKFPPNYDYRKDLYLMQTAEDELQGYDWSNLLTGIMEQQLTGASVFALASCMLADIRGMFAMLTKNEYEAIRMILIDPNRYSTNHLFYVDGQAHMLIKNESGILHGKMVTGLGGCIIGITDKTLVVGIYRPPITSERCVEVIKEAGKKVTRACY